MSVTYTKMINQVVTMLADPDSDFCTTDEIRIWVQYYIQEFAEITRALKSYASYSWSASTPEVSLSSIITDSDHLDPLIEKAEWTYDTTSGTYPLLVSKDDVWHRDPERHATDFEGIPNKLYYDMYQKTIGLYPTSPNAGTLKVFYSYIPTEFTSDSLTIETDLEPYWKGICAAAAAAGKMKDKERYSEASVSQSFSLYNAAIRRAKYRRACKDGQGTVGYSRSYPRW